jgi:hypothetical protein
MTTKSLNTRPVFNSYGKRPRPALLERPHGRFDDAWLTRTESAMSWDPDLDRWTNEGGAVRDHPTLAVEPSTSPAMR